MHVPKPVIREDWLGIKLAHITILAVFLGQMTLRGLIVRGKNVRIARAKF